jgi:hypothetical protein
LDRQDAAVGVVDAHDFLSLGVGGGGPQAGGQVIAVLDGSVFGIGVSLVPAAGSLTAAF